MLQTKENPIVGQFDSNYKSIETKTAMGSFHQEIETDSLHEQPDNSKNKQRLSERLSNIFKAMRNKN